MPWKKSSLEAQRYSQGLLVRRVETSGCISLQNWRGSIGRAFGHLPIGLTPVRPMCYRVYFANLYLGQLDLKAGGKLDIAPY